MSNVIDLTMDTDSDDDKIIIVDHKFKTTIKNEARSNPTMSLSMPLRSSESFKSFQESTKPSLVEEDTPTFSNKTYLSGLLHSLSTTLAMVETNNLQYDLAVAHFRHQLVNFAHDLLRAHNAHRLDPGYWVSVGLVESEPDFRDIMAAAEALSNGFEDAASKSHSITRSFAAQRSLLTFLLRLKSLPEESWPDLVLPVSWDAHRQGTSQVTSTSLPSTIDKKIDELGTKPIHQPSPRKALRAVRQSPEVKSILSLREQDSSSRLKSPPQRNSEPPRKKPRTDGPQTDPPNLDPLWSADGTISQLDRRITSHRFRGNTKAEPEDQNDSQGIDPDNGPSDYMEDDDGDGLSDYKSETESRGSAEDYHRLHAGYDIHDESLWEVRRAPADDDDINIDELLLDNGSSNTFNPPREVRPTKGGKIVRPAGGQFIWDLVGQIQQRVSAGQTRQKPSKFIRVPGYGKQRYVKDAVQTVASFKVGPGAINRIEQHSGWLAIGAARAGGQADEPDEEPRDPDPYNDPGSLFTWNGQCRILPGHTRAKPTGRRDESGAEVRLDKCYTVNDIKFNHSGTCFVSLGMDRRAKFWTKGEEGFFERSTLGNDLDVYDGVPFEVAFQPSTGESNVVAVGVKNIYVYPDVNHGSHRMKTTLILPPKTHPRHNTGAIRWDPDKPHILYASSEPDDDTSIGVHKAFDLNEGRNSGLRFDVSEAGDAMAVNPGVLALATRGETSHSLRLFDIRRFTPRCTQKIELELSSGGASDLEVSCMTFSPDSLYIALARTDNRIHIYDSRMLGRGVLHNYRHEEQNPLFNAPGTMFYGVSHIQWITTHTGQFALLSGGDDGCVRLWNPTWSAKEPTNGREIVEISRDIGVFSVGDPFKNEYDLVVGDSSGEVTVFTGLLNYL